MKEIEQEIETGIKSLVALIELSGVDDLDKIIKEELWQKK